MFIGSMEGLGRLANRFLTNFGIRIMRLRDFERLQNEAAQVRYQKLSNRFPQYHDAITEIAPLARSQNGQDLMALICFEFADSGFFVEFGATDGMEGSNTYILEKEFNWSGILAEPAREWHKNLKRNRDCKIDTRAVWKSSGMTFEFVESGQYSTLRDYAENRTFGSASRKYEVETISLFDLLVEKSAPNHIDFLSIDTEGSEFEILKDFPFHRYSFGFISVEHNGMEAEREIAALLTRMGYLQIMQKESGYDSWFISKEVYDRIFG